MITITYIGGFWNARTIEFENAVLSPIWDNRCFHASETARELEGKNQTFRFYGYGFADDGMRHYTKICCDQCAVKLGVIW